MTTGGEDVGILLELGSLLAANGGIGEQRILLVLLKLRSRTNRNFSFAVFLLGHDGDLGATFR